jgi:hypothetical protein
MKYRAPRAREGIEIERRIYDALIELARIIHGGRQPRSKPLRSRAMGRNLEEACLLKR